MPIYLYQHPETDQVIEIIQSVHDEHVYVDSDGVIWNRIFTVPTASVDSNIDPTNVNAFVEKTGKGKETMGGIWDRSKEMSEARAKIYGTDPLRDKHYKDHMKNYGTKHPDQIKESRNKAVSVKLNVPKK